jgi:hypothetical protein
MHLKPSMHLYTLVTVLRRPFHILPSVRYELHALHTATTRMLMRGPGANEPRRRMPGCRKVNQLSEAACRFCLVAGCDIKTGFANHSFRATQTTTHKLVVAWLLYTRVKKSHFVANSGVVEDRGVSSDLHTARESVQLTCHLGHIPAVDEQSWLTVRNHNCALRT